MFKKNIFNLALFSFHLLMKAMILENRLVLVCSISVLAQNIMVFYCAKDITKSWYYKTEGGVLVLVSECHILTNVSTLSVYC
jgi:hypothetical protein